MVFFLLDCSSSEVECHVVWASMLTEFILDGDGWMDFDDVSLVDGYNMPMPCWFTSAAPCELCSSYEDTISTFACNHTNYSMTFCPQSNPNRKPQLYDWSLEKQDHIIEVLMVMHLLV
ncbi:hypothetical protein CFC21_038604 [Triticum aestivum]|uniref:Uncharacterized protein n=4 Tax=Triticum TaxID=4564 RepID=A0A9R0VSZ0_TRITD|nr:hypothetical protein TRIUR3_02363 [Triticum urartu]KAF7026492.1 hypothetical protein CFC21_038604 [Triticum aestivum]VAH70220.1 unnamed protein product [Triticum turgidum subsp. durum]